MSQEIDLITAKKAQKLANQVYEGVYIVQDKARSGEYGMVRESYDSPGLRDLFDFIALVRPNNN